MRITRPSILEAVAAILTMAIVWTYVSPQSFRPRGDPRATAQLDLAQIQAALAMYRVDTDHYPTAAQGLAALRRAPTAPPPWNWRGPYLLRELPTDPWGHAYVYEREDTAGVESVRLMSYGADGKPGGSGMNADIVVHG